ncbi:ketopantoate reductase family protein [Ornatilinea apprima]|uniref:ketopantoate reductase family protein n=1 Tax=Ornatilinea apprima TaxID=1134406 RepID=UPI000946855A|nr:2-dehydropantoate 2-reductase N-terminal domain-containing protein [Ornatilinea apprima]
MKTLIVGSGVIGTIYGWALAEAGADVTHFVRPGKAAQLQNGVSLDVLDERKGYKPNQQTRYAIRCVEEVRPQDGYELVIVPVNVNQLEDALKTLVPCVGEQAVFLTLTANWEGPAVLDHYLPRNRYWMGYADGGGTIRDGVYWTNLGAEIHLGVIEGQDEQRLLPIKTLFERAGMKPDMQANMLHWLWVHNASAVGFAAGFAKYKEFQSYFKDYDLLKTCLHATRELLTLCEKRGVRLADYPEVSYMGWPDWLVLGIMRWMFATNRSMQRYTAHAASAGSLRETKANFDAMLLTAEETGTPVPALRSLYIYLQNQGKQS